MAQFIAIAPVVAFAAFAVGCILAIRSMLNEMAAKFRQITLEPVLAASADRKPARQGLRHKPAAAEIVALPRRPAAIRPKLRAPLPVAA